MNNIRIAKELVRLAKNLVADQDLRKKVEDLRKEYFNEAWFNDTDVLIEYIKIKGKKLMHFNEEDFKSRLNDALEGDIGRTMYVMDGRKVFSKKNDGNVEIGAGEIFSLGFEEVINGQYWDYRKLNEKLPVSNRSDIVNKFKEILKNRDDKDKFEKLQNELCSEFKKFKIIHYDIFMDINNI